MQHLCMETACNGCARDLFFIGQDKISALVILSISLFLLYYLYRRLCFIHMNEGELTTRNSGSRGFGVSRVYSWIVS